MKTYRGDRGLRITSGPHPRRASRVMIDDRPLPPRLDLRNHSPTGLAWGYDGSGPAQLALALLCDHLDDDEEAQDLYQDFKWRVIARLPSGEWSLTSGDIAHALGQIRAERATGADLSPEEVPFCRTRP